MSVLLLDRAGFGTVPAKPAPVPAENFDDIVSESGATHHARLLHSMGSTITDVIGSIDWTVNNTIGWQRGALLTAGNGGNSAFFDGVGVTPTYAEATNLITSATWAAGFLLQFDGIQAKAVLLDAVDADGGYSIEVEPDATGMHVRQFTRVSGSADIWTTGDDTVPTSDAILLVYVQISDAVSGGRFVYAGTASSFDLIGSNTSVKTFPAVPAGTHYLGAWNVKGGVQAPFKGLLGEAVVWDGLVPSLATMQTLAAKVQNVVFVNDFNAGSVQVGNTLSIDVGANTNPSEAFTPVKLTNPAAGGGTVAVVGEGFQVTGHDTADSYSFDYRIDRGSLQSSTATISYTVTTAAPTVGIQLPAFDYQTHNDAVPSGAIWWDPINGSDGNDGLSEANAKKTFSGVQEVIGAGDTIVVPGGAYAVPELTFEKSGTSGNRITLMSKPGEEVVFYREGDFVGGVEKTWTWTLVDASLSIYQSPDLGLVGKTIVNNNNGSGQVSNGLWGILRTPTGCWGRPHLMRLMWYDLDGDRKSVV